MSMVRRFRRQILFLLPVLMGAGPVAARTTQDPQAWFNINIQGTITGRALYYGEIQPRLFDNAGRLGQLLIRPALGYQLSETVSVWQGYAHIIQPGEVGQKGVHEDRSFQQITWSLGAVAGGKLSSRTRFEQRWRTDGDDMALRVRNLLRYTHPLGANPTGPALLVSVEPFVALNDTDWGVRSGFDQLRTNIGVELPLPGKSWVEVGYLNQFVNRPGGNHQANHVGLVTLSIRP
jgi:hypothetical protein